MIYINNPFRKEEITSLVKNNEIAVFVKDDQLQIEGVIKKTCNIFSSDSIMITKENNQYVINDTIDSNNKNGIIIDIEHAKDSSSVWSLESNVESENYYIYDKFKLNNEGEEQDYVYTNLLIIKLK